jgi:AP-1 complex subunit gamma-1
LTFFIYYSLKAGNYVRDDVVSSTLQLVSDSPAIHSEAVGLLWDAVKSLKNIEDYQPLVQVCCWCVGEYGDSLVDVSMEDVLENFQQMLWSPHVSIVTRQYCLMALEKLSARVPETTDRIR